jgi:hypothetical protein
MKLEDILRQVDTEDIDGHRFSPSSSITQQCSGVGEPSIPLAGARNMAA